MTKRLQSKYSVCKKLNSAYKNLWGLKNKDSLRSVRLKKKKRTTSYGKILKIKQSLRLFYSNLKERCFRYYIKISVMSFSTTIDKLISIIESRLDAVLYRSCFVISFQEARQFINHGFVTVNSLKVTFCAKNITKGDIIKLNKRYLNKNNFSNSLYSRFFPGYLELDIVNFSIIFLWTVHLKNVYYPLKIKYFHLLRFFK